MRSAEFFRYRILPLASGASSDYCFESGSPTNFGGWFLDFLALRGADQWNFLAGMGFWGRGRR